MQPVEIQAKTVEEAIEKAQLMFNLSREELQIEIITNGSSGLLGLVGAKKAKIRVQPAEGEPEEQESDLIDQARQVLEEILKRLQIENSIDSRGEEEKIFLNINGDGSGLLIGRKGKTLDALQYLVNKIVNRKAGDRKKVIIDTENYRARRKESLANMALRLSKKVKEKGKPFATSALSSQDRRIVYLALQKESLVTSKSEGEGSFKKVVISPKK